VQRTKNPTKATRSLRGNPPKSGDDQTLYTLIELTNQYVYSLSVTLSYQICTQTHIVKRLRLRSNICVATRVDLRASCRAPNTSCPVSAKRDVKDDIHIPEPGIKVTAPSAEICHWSTPRIRVWVAVANIDRHVSTGEVPHLDS
jgi:hypothetical protein